MTRNCKVCNSPFRVEYENMFLNSEPRKDIKEIWRYAHTVRNENISYPGMARHFKNHVEKYLEIRRGVEKEREAMLGKLLNEDVELAKRIRDHLSIIEEQIKRYKGMDLEPEEAKIVIDWINSARMSIEQLLKWRDRLMPQDEPIEDLASKIIEMVSDFPPEYLNKFTDRLNKYIEDNRKGY